MLDLDAHPHAKAVLGAALKDAPAHAYLFHGPAGSGKRETARTFAAELLAKGAKDPENAKTRAQHGAHPDLTWVTPSGAHEMLRTGRRRGRRLRRRAHAVRGAAPGVRARAGRRDERRDRELAPEDARGAGRVRRADPAHRPAHAGAADDREPLPARALRRADDRPARADAATPGVPQQTAHAAARLALGDGEKAVQLAAPTACSCAPRPSSSPARPSTATPASARGGRSSTAPAIRARRRRPRSSCSSRRSSSSSPRRSTSGARPSSPSGRNAPSGGPRRKALDHALQLTGLWYRDLACVQAQAPELVFHSDRVDQLKRTPTAHEPTSRRRSSSTTPAPG